MLSRAARLTWLVTGLLALALGVIGIALPLLPTTPFILLAAFSFARSSKRLHEWLVGHDVFGALIRNWQQHGAIGRRTKAVSVATMAALPLISVAMRVPAAVVVVQLVVLGAVAGFILSRPSPPED